MNLHFPCPENEKISNFKKKEKNKVKCGLTLIRGKKPRVYTMRAFDFKALHHLSLWINLFGKRVCFFSPKLYQGGNLYKRRNSTQILAGFRFWYRDAFLWERKLLGIVFKSQICTEPWSHLQKSKPCFKSSFLTWSLIIIWIRIIQILYILKSFAEDFKIEQSVQTRLSRFSIINSYSWNLRDFSER